MKPQWIERRDYGSADWHKLPVLRSRPARRVRRIRIEAVAIAAIVVGLVGLVVIGG